MNNFHLTDYFGRIGGHEGELGGHEVQRDARCDLLGVSVEDVGFDSSAGRGYKHLRLAPCKNQPIGDGDKTKKRSRQLK
ncbi:hypothetical protein GUJ93_ZPchr0002g24822 [Zizania palustris]|uniref:Uncharacterized protein n=1 Tax=Zizania palustris TaxID=103762 RepID=A0A8J5RS95_ZIZPA|nr:hypothetical protein GUJ93_ZPchr0002g24822 [Zizania palustris]